MAITKNRYETDSFQIDFTRRLVEGETIVSVDIVVEWAALFKWNDVTADCLSGDPTIADGVITFLLMAAPTDEDQVPGQYRVRAAATTSSNRKLVNVVDLTITL